ncbi:helix-turn-helix transcriptional regulator [uncultured Streptococcus sp.]|uniref:helix-turn-helix domain-containing protein n=1 Tax=uncultured Streptococcus sp. TaxID=83427 RepID=UPI00057CA199|nr:helix-turn-helix transcriptional regulator [Streptococcus gallolyticus]
MGTVDFREYLDKRLENKEFRKGYTEELDKLLSSVAVMRAREEMGYTQKELAEKANLPQSTIARIERGANTSVETLSKLAIALDKKLVISFS